MKSISHEEVEDYINTNIGVFHHSRINRLKHIKLKQILQKKNPYLFKAKNILTSEKLVESLLQAYLSSSEEGLFGGFLEDLAIFIAGKTLGGKKSPGTGIDLDFTRGKITYLVSIKSGVNWGNSSQYAALRNRFKNAVQVLKQSRTIKAVQPVLASCYGKRKTVDNGEYLSICGQDFWYLISGNKNFYTDIFEPLGYQAKQHSQNYNEELAVIINKFTAEFSSDFCSKGKIDWKKLVKFNSGNL